MYKFNMRTALQKKTVLFNHVLRNVLIPIITIFGLSIPSLVGGAFITETVFSWPGLGSLGVNAIFRFDYPIIMAITLLSSFMLILGNLIADIFIWRSRSAHSNEG